MLELPLADALRRFVLEEGDEVVFASGFGFELVDLVLDELFLLAEHLGFGL